MMKFLQERRGYQLVTQRQPRARLTGLHLLESRAAMAREHLPARRKLPISTCPSDDANTPSPVTIVRVRKPHPPAATGC